MCVCVMCVVYVLCVLMCVCSVCLYVCMYVFLFLGIILSHVVACFVGLCILSYGKCLLGFNFFFEIFLVHWLYFPVCQHAFSMEDG